MVDNFIPTILMNLLLVQYFLALSNFLSNKLKKKNGKYIKIETNTNKYSILILEFYIVLRVTNVDCINYK